MTIDTRLLIIGAGPAGLATAYAFGDGCIVLEKEHTVGGLCRSIEHEGGVFDIGGHSFHTPHPEVFELVQHLLGGDLFLQKRDARVLWRGSLIPYPFQKFFEEIPDPEVVRECKEGLELAARSEAPEPRDFEEYLIQRFGRGIAEHFMLPYNRKLWARDIRQISCEWTSERVAAPKGESETFDTRHGRRKPLQPDTLVGYPAVGGFETIYRAFVPHIPRLEVNQQVTRVNLRDRTAHTVNGRVYRWEALVSTVPLPTLVRLVEPTPSRIVEAADELDYMSLRVELLLTDAPLETTIQRIYCADADIPPHKTALNHNSSPSLRSRAHHAIMAEVSVSEEKDVDVDRIASRTIDFLCEAGILPGPGSIVWTGHIDVEYAYPVYTHERPRLVREIKEWAEPHNLFTVGRFGEWEYINSDKCVMKGLHLGRELRERLGLEDAEPWTPIAGAGQ